MTALEIIGMILLLFLLLSLLRVGAIVDFGGELRVRLRVGPVKLTVLPRKEKKAQKKAAEAAGETPEEKTKPKAAGGHRLPKLSFPELRELAGTVLGALKRTLRRTCRRTRIDPLEVGVIFAGDDPADTAQTYGYANAGNVYDKFTVELRYPLILQPSSTIFALLFLEGGNCWSDIRDFNPFQIKRSAGVGVRVFLPMIGLLGVDWGWGFDDPVNGKSQFHFVIGQQF